MLRLSLFVISEIEIKKYAFCISEAGQFAIGTKQSSGCAASCYRICSAHLRRYRSSSHTGDNSARESPFNVTSYNARSRWQCFSNPPPVSATHHVTSQVSYLSKCHAPAVHICN